MRFFDFLRFAITGLWRQKVRTGLTILGVAVGACSLAFSLSLGVGLRRVITNEFHSRPGFWQIHVSEGFRERPTANADAVPLPAELSPARAQRIRAELVERAMQQNAIHDVVVITPEKLDEFRALPDVEDVRTFRHFQGLVRLGDASTTTLFVATPCDRPELQNLLVAGRVPRETGEREVVVPEMLLYDLGLTRESDMNAALGRSLIVELGGRSDARQLSFLTSINSGFNGALTLSQGMVLLKLLAELPKLIEQSSLTTSEKAEARKLLVPPETKSEQPGRYPIVESYTIVGIRRDVSEEERKSSNWHLNQNSVFASAAGGENIFRRLHNIQDGRFDHAEIHVRRGGDLPAVVEAIESQGFRTQSSLRWFNNARREVTAIAVALNIFAWISLIVAAIGITNTLVTNVVERTREIGILKAIGASRGQINRIFLLEGTLIGTFGGLLGLTIARLGAGPADELVRGEIQRQMRGETMLSSSVFEFPLWLSLATFGAAAIITTVAAVYPARRASRIEPIEALKYG